MPTRVTVTIHQDKIRRIFDRTTTELRSWSAEVGREIDKVTPEDTGALIESRTVPRVTVRGDKNIAVWWYWKVPYAAIVEFAWGGKYGPRLPGRIAPFARPTIRRAVDKTLGGAMGRGFRI